MKARKQSQSLVFLLFFFVPYLNLFRLDIPSGHYYWLTRKFPFTESLTLLLTVLWLVFLVLGLNVFKPRMFCSHFCPHGTVSQWFRNLQAAKLDLLLGLLLTPVVAFTLLAYFVAPSTAWQAIAHGTSAIILTFFIALCLFIGFLLVRLRQKFCANVCPYGFFQQLVTPENPTTGKKIIAGSLITLLGGAMAVSALLTPTTQVEISNTARVRTGDSMTYAYTLTLANNKAKADAFRIRFTQWKPLGGGFEQPVPLGPGEEKTLPLAFQVRQTEHVRLDVCAESANACRSFDFSLSGP